MKSLLRTRMQTVNFPALLVLNRGDASMSLVDPVRNLEVAVIVEGVPSTISRDVATSPNGKIAYLPLYGNARLGEPGKGGRMVLAFDLTRKKVINRLDLMDGARPHCVVYDHNHHLLYVTAEQANSVAVIDPAEMKIIGEIPTHHEQSHALAISHDGRRGYTANVSSGTVSVLDLKARRFLAEIAVSPRVQRVSVSIDDRLVFATDQTQARIAVMDAAKKRIKQWVPLPSIGYGSAATHDGRFLLVTLPMLGELAVIDLELMKVVRSIRVGPRPHEVLLRPDRPTAYVSCPGSHQVTVVDLEQWRVTAKIDVGRRPDGMAWAGPTE